MGFEPPPLSSNTALNHLTNDIVWYKYETYNISNLNGNQNYTYLLLLNKKYLICNYIISIVYH